MSAMMGLWRPSRYSQN